MILLVWNYIFAYLMIAFLADTEYTNFNYFVGQCLPILASVMTIIFLHKAKDLMGIKRFLNEFSHDIEHHLPENPQPCKKDGAKTSTGKNARRAA